MNAPPPGERELTAQVRQLQRERSTLVACCVLALAFALMQRIGGRVYSVAITKGPDQPYVEYVYVAQKAQAEAALAEVKRRAREAHPYYSDKTNADVFDHARPGFAERWLITRVHRQANVVRGTGSETPVKAAADVLEKALHVTVNAYGIYDKNSPKPVALLPTDADARQALNTRLDNVHRQVNAELRAPDHLVKWEYLQEVDVRPVVGALASEVLSVQQAVEYLATGDARGAEHEVQTGELARNIADKYGAKLEDLSAWNPGRDLRRLKTGDKLIVRRHEAPLTVLTIEERTRRENGHEVHLQVRRHNGVRQNESPVR